MRHIGYTLLVIGVLVGLWAIGIFGTILGTATNVAITQPARIINKTFDADNVLFQYHWFQQQAEDVNAITSKLAASTSALEQLKDDLGERSGWTFEDKQQYAQRSSMVLGLQNQRAQMIADYNAKSHQVDRSIFKNPPIIAGQLQPILPEVLTN